MKKRSGSNDLPVPEKVERIALPSGNIKLRVILLAAAVAVAISSFAWGLNRLLSVEGGMQEIDALTGEMNCAGDFTFYYDLGASGEDPADERRALRTLYGQAAHDALEIFSADDGFDGRLNLYNLNSRPNEDTPVDPALYSALETLVASGDRHVYLGPLCELGVSLWQSSSDEEAALYDPRRDASLGAFAADIAAFARDEGAVSLELLGDNRVRLNVSDEYLSYASANGVTRFVDLGWLKNAFIADYLCGVMLDAGYTRGSFVSRDGFMRLGEGTDAALTLAFTHREGASVMQAGSISYGGGLSVVFLRDYPLREGEDYYVYADGEIRSPYLDTADGLDRAAISELALNSDRHGCAGLALMAADIYISGSLDMDALYALVDEGIEAHYYKNGEIINTRLE